MSLRILRPVDYVLEYLLYRTRVLTVLSTVKRTAAHIHTWVFKIQLFAAVLSTVQLLLLQYKYYSILLAL
jgi:hypothetical protein